MTEGEECQMKTFTMGPSLKVKESISKGRFLELCEEMSLMLGDGHVIQPLRGKGWGWKEWPGRREGEPGGKELRLVLHGKVKQFGGLVVPWPEVPGNVMELWRGDASVALRAGVYRTHIVAYGGAKHWNKDEVEAVRVALLKFGVGVSLAYNLRGYGKFRRGERDPSDRRYV
jgi:hypothetical protein